MLGAISSSGLTKVNSLWPGDTIWWHRSGTTLLQIMVWCLLTPSHYLNQHCHIINGSLKHSPGAISQQVLKMKCVQISKLLPHLPGANELKCQDSSFEITATSMTIWRVEYMYNAPGGREHPQKHSIMDNQVCAQLQDMEKKTCLMLSPMMGWRRMFYKVQMYFRNDQPYTVETLYSTIYYSKYFIELNFDKSTQYVALWTHKRHPIPRPFGRAMECLLWVLQQKLTVL